MTQRLEHTLGTVLEYSGSVDARVWDAVAQRVPERARWIEVLGASLEEAEERRRTTVEGQLVKMVGREVMGPSLEEAEERRWTTVEGQIVKLVGW
eukprot:1160256-Pelagomonas_calceolata.AAC.27